ncbi:MULTISPECIES: hypothetical protein [unclassified Polaromonas]|uniref:hypothetical protein n=1 Tax=unclassified Polaromonas TaxID=2638319 RepID=UPI0018CB50C0|nr:MULTISPECIES: hypothetical protein [unclassified Polaromonas]MBG6070799.1 hypothetical protein [Polaromonas sp. CG_9.7]MBG6112891.1 hypothetical protein [Polaromonas sp. CG_9.2]MDH6186364.1 hypothetical protein [Polaromonas sp. CG_23.6]
MQGIKEEKNSLNLCRSEKGTNQKEAFDNRVRTELLTNYFVAKRQQVDRQATNQETVF